MKKPEIFKPKINHSVNNNQNAYYSFLDDDRKDNDKSYETPIETLDRLIKNNSYVFNKQVLIVTKTGEYLTKIAGKIGTKVITLDGDSIDINDITKIIEK